MDAADFEGLPASAGLPAWAMTPIEIRNPARRWSGGISVPWPTGATAGNHSHPLLVEVLELGRLA